VIEIVSCVADDVVYDRAAGSGPASVPPVIEILLCSNVLPLSSIA
jgi:hypothetical protein